MIQCKQICICNLLNQQEHTRLNLPFICGKHQAQSSCLTRQGPVSMDHTAAVNQVPHYCPAPVTSRSSVKGQVCQIPRCVQDTHLITTDHRILIFGHERYSSNSNIKALYDFIFSPSLYYRSVGQKRDWCCFLGR